MKPLEHQTILVTRGAGDFDSSANEIERLGGTAAACPMIAFEPPDHSGPLDQAIARLDRYDWVIYTSANSVRFFLDRHRDRGGSREALERVRAAVIGPATRKALEDEGLRAHFTAARATGKDFFGEFAAAERVAGKKFLLPCSQIAHKTLPNLLRQHGAEVDDVAAYCTRPAGQLPPKVLPMLLNGEIDWILFTSSSTAVFFMECLAGEPEAKRNIRAASIGPSTSASLRALGVEPAVEAEDHSIGGLLDAIVRVIQSKRDSA